MQATLTWTMTSSTGATITYDSNDLDIISIRKSGQLAWADGKPRFWNGFEAMNDPGYDYKQGISVHFTSGTTCRQWWHNYAISATLNGGSPISLNSTSSSGSGAGEQVAGSVATSSAQTRYINAQLPVKGSAFVSGDVVVFTVTAV